MRFFLVWSDLALKQFTPSGSRGLSPAQPSTHPSPSSLGIDDLRLLEVVCCSYVRKGDPPLTYRARGSTFSDQMTGA